MKQRLADTEKAINNMVNAIQAGIFTSSTKKRLDELEETKSQLEISIIQEEMKQPVFTREQILQFLHHFRETDVTDQKQRQKLVDCFVNSVFLFDDRIMLTFNYREGTHVLSLSAVQGSDLSSLAAPCLQSRFPLIEGIGSVAISKQVLMVVLITITDWKRASHLQCSPCLRSLDIVGAHSG